MELDNAFAVHAPIDQVWTTLQDVEQVARCVPGARVLNQLSDDAYQVGMRVKVGPVTMQYRGQIEVVERDEHQHRAVLHGKGKETRGQGTADATVEMRLAEEDGRTQGTVHADVRLSGRAAAMGQGIIADVAQQMVDQFARNLQDVLSGEPVGGDIPDDAPEVPERSGADVEEAVEVASRGSHHRGVERPPEEATPGTAPVEQVESDPDMTLGEVVHGPGAAGGPEPDPPTFPPQGAAVGGGAQSLPGARVSDRIAAGDVHPSAASLADDEDEGGILDAGSLVVAVLRSRMADPRALLGLLLAVAVVAFRLGRRRGLRTYRVEDVERIASLLRSP